MGRVHLLKRPRKHRAPIETLLPELDESEQPDHLPAQHQGRADEQQNRDESLAELIHVVDYAPGGLFG
jgi:hypothetical protein